MKKSVLAGASIIAIALATSGVAWAADVPMKARPYAAAPQVFNWSGWYAGGILSTSTGKVYSASNPADGTSPHARGGALLGFNVQNGNVVWGLESDVVFGSTKINMSDQFVKVRTTASIRGRLGWAFDRVLVYGTGGAGYLKIRGVSSAATSIATKQWRPVVGAGIEGALTNNWILGAEYLTYLGNKNLSAGFDEATILKKVDEFRVRLSYKFDTGGKGPVSAKY